MKGIVFDAGPIISLTTNNLLWVLDELARHYNGRFFIPGSVKRELIDKPLETKKFKFEALQVMQSIRNGTLQVIDTKEIRKRGFELLDLANHCFKGRNRWLKIVHQGEMEALAAAILIGADAVVVDERTTLMMVDCPLQLTDIWKKRMRVNVKISTDNLKRFSSHVHKIKTLRSVEFVMRAFELGILDDYLPHKTDTVSNPKRTLIDSLLWGLKIHGASIRRDEIEEIIETES